MTTNKIKQTWERFIAALISAKAAMWEMYTEEGAPYGTTDKGFHRWLDSYRTKE